MGFLPAFGVSYSDNATESVLELYDQAALAVQIAKKDFKNRICYFHPAMYEQTAEDYQILSDFQKGLQENSIKFYLQPQCRASTGKIVGAEALARWQKKDGTMVPPVDFVPVLEKYGFIPDLDKYVWRNVCRWLRESIDKGLPAIPISVNVSPVDIFTFQVAEYLCSLVDEYQIPLWRGFGKGAGGCG